MIARTVSTTAHVDRVHGRLGFVLNVTLTKITSASRPELFYLRVISYGPSTSV